MVSGTVTACSAGTGGAVQRVGHGGEELLGLGGASPDGGDADPAVDPERLADLITEDVIQQLYASRQDLAEVTERGDGDVDAVSDQLLSIIGNLRDIATVLRGRDAGATRVPERVASGSAADGGGSAVR